MKQWHCLSVLIGGVLAVMNCSAQKLYFGVAGGYGFSFAPQNIGASIKEGISQTSNSIVRGSFGKGIIAGGYIGYKKNEYIAFELSGSYLYGNKYKSHYIKEQDFTENTALSATMFRLAPGIRLTAGDGKTRPYARIGLTFRVFGKITIKDNYYDIQNSSTTASVWQYRNGFSAGLCAALGVTHRINDRFSVFGECGMISQSWGPKKAKLTAYAIDGVDQLDRMTPYQKETDFLNSYTTTNNNLSTAYAHRQQLRQYYSFSSLGINIGIQYSFGKK